jgi:hypothetical protein
VTINVTMAEPVQAEDDLREEVVPDEALALLWHEPNQGQMSFLEMRVPMGAFGMLDENEFDALLGVGNEGDRQVRRIG